MLRCERGIVQVDDMGWRSEPHCVCRTTKKSKGIALAQFAEPANAVAAHAGLDRAIFQGRLLHILPGQRPPPAPDAERVRRHLTSRQGMSTLTSAFPCVMLYRLLTVWCRYDHVAVALLATA